MIQSSVLITLLVVQNRQRFLMKYKAIIFDMDGTIIATESAWEQSDKALLKKYGNLNEQECHAILPFLKGASLYTTSAYIKKTFNPTASIEEIMEAKQQYAFNCFEKNIKYIDGFDSFHQKLTSLNMASAIATNANQRSLDEVLKKVPLANFFNEHIYSIDRVNKLPKPLPDIYLYAAQQLSIAPHECIAIEDSSHGIAAAKSAGMFCIGINTGQDRQALAQADCIIEKYDEINLENILQG